MNKEYRAIMWLIVGGSLGIALWACESQTVRDSVQDDAAEVSNEAADIEDRCNGAVNYPENHPCHIPPR